MLLLGAVVVFDEGERFVVTANIERVMKAVVNEIIICCCF